MGQRGHGVAHGHREVGVRARADLRHARVGGAGPVRVHRGRLQQGEDTLGAGLFDPRRVRRGQLAQGKQPLEGGVKGVNGIGVDSDSGAASPSLPLDGRQSQFESRLVVVLIAIALFDAIVLGDDPAIARADTSKFIALKFHDDLLCRGGFSAGFFRVSSRLH